MVTLGDGTTLEESFAITAPSTLVARIVPALPVARRRPKRTEPGKRSLGWNVVHSVGHHHSTHRDGRPLFTTDRHSDLVSQHFP